MKRFFVGAVLIVVTALIGFFALHYSQGANGSDAAAMVLDDVKVLTTCPTQLGNVANFVLRPDSVPITSELSKNESLRVLDAICNGDIFTARKLILDNRNARLVQAPNVSPTAASVPSPSPTPTEVVAKAPLDTATPKARQAVVTKPTPTSPPVRPTVARRIKPTSTAVPTKVASKASGFFESLNDLRNSSGAAQPNIDVRQLAERVHALINAERNKNRLGPLAFDSKIASIAQNHSVDMALNDYFAHDNLQGLDPTDRGATVGYDCIKRYGTRYTFGLAENIHQGWLYSSTTYFNGVPIRDWNTQDELTVVAVRGWMNSAGHRENILTDTYDRSGVGVAIAEDDKVYITQNFF